jgi:hypothetical protein
MLPNFPKYRVKSLAVVGYTYARAAMVSSYGVFLGRFPIPINLWAYFEVIAS